MKGCKSVVHVGKRAGDVLQLRLEDLPLATGLIAGPPCPPWSSIGKKVVVFTKAMQTWGRESCFLQVNGPHVTAGFRSPGFDLPSKWLCRREWSWGFPGRDPHVSEIPIYRGIGHQTIHGVNQRICTAGPPPPPGTCVDSHRQPYAALPIGPRYIGISEPCQSARWLGPIVIAQYCLWFPAGRFGAVLGCKHMANRPKSTRSQTNQPATHVFPEVSHMVHMHTVVP